MPPRPAAPASLRRPEARTHRDPHHRRTVARLRDRMERLPLATIALMTLLLGIHLLLGWWDWRHAHVDGWGVLYGERSKEALERFGGRDRERVAAGEYARLLSCGLVHGGFGHLLLNLLALWGLGRLAEVIWGPSRALVLFGGSVLGGALLSQAVGGPLAVGASGGVFGILGGLVAFGTARRSDLHPRLVRWLTRGLWPWLALNLGMGFLVPGIDNAGHVGGLVAGAALGPLLADHLRDRRGARTGADVAAWLLLGTGAAIALGKVAMGLGG